MKYLTPILLFVACVFGFSVFTFGSDYAQPPYEIKDHAINENFRQIYYDVDNLSMAGAYYRSYTAAADAVTFSVTETYYNVASIVLPDAGDYDVTGVLVVASNGGTVSGPYVAALSAYSGDTKTDHVGGDNAVSFLPSSAIADPTLIIPSWRVTVSEQTTIYLKGGAYFSAGTGPRGYGRISARLVRKN